MLERTLTLDVQQLNLAVSVFLPLLVGIVTQRVTDPKVKGSLLTLLTVVTGTVTSLIEAGGRFDLGQLLTGIVVSFFTAQAAYSFGWKPSKVALAVQEVTDRIGVGAVVKPRADEPSGTASTVVVNNPPQVVKYHPQPAAAPVPEAQPEPSWSTPADPDAQPVDEAVDDFGPSGDDDDAAAWLDPSPVVYEDGTVDTPAAPVLDDERTPYDEETDPEVDIIEPDELQGEQPAARGSAAVVQ